jgi:hypothetical protein
LAAGDLAAIPEQYQTALDAGDKLWAWLIQREGLVLLDVGIDEPGRAQDIAEGGRLRMARDKLDQAALGGVEGELREQERELRDLAHKLSQPYTDFEKRAFMIETAERHNLTNVARLWREGAPLPAGV